MKNWIYVRSCIGTWYKNNPPIESKGAAPELDETKGTLHGYDIVQDVPPGTLWQDVLPLYC